MKKGDSIGFFELVSQIGEGGFGGVWMVKSTEDDKFYAMKMEPTSSKRQTLKFESQILKKLQSSDMFPKYVIDGTDNGNFYSVMELLGPNISSISQKMPDGHFAKEYMPKLTLRLLSILEQFHAKGYVHRDIKPQNFVVRLSGKSPICLIDFGISRIYVDAGGNHIEARDHANAMGSSLYSSPNMHDHIELSRRDDLFSLIYSILDISGMPIPWRGIPTLSEVASLKKNNPISKLCEPLGEGFVEIAKHIESLGYADAPNYALMKEAMNKAISETPTEKEFQWMTQNPPENVKVAPENNWDPCGFLLYMAPHLRQNGKEGGCLLI